MPKPIFPFIDLDVKHKDGTSGKIVGLDAKKICFFKVIFEDGVETSHHSSKLFWRDVSIESYLHEDNIDQEKWSELIRTANDLNYSSTKIDVWTDIVGQITQRKIDSKQIKEIHLKHKRKLDSHSLFRRVNFDNGDMYEGFIVQGKFHGKGLYLYFDGSKYDGDWEKGKYSGNGKLNFNSGFYNGGWLKGKKHGFGSLFRNDGMSYVGDWLQDEFSGNGKIIHQNGDEYEGQFLKGKMNGKGIYKFSSGESYEGYFKNNFINGYGIYIWANGNKYEGEWKNDQRSGKGALIDKDNNILEENNF
jgi:hypothetical protein